MKNEYEALGAWIFAGGFTLGVDNHFNIRGHLEEGSFGVETFLKNRPDVPVHVGPANWPEKKFKNLDLLYVNPPCAAWSAAGRTMLHGGKNWRTDARADCSARASDLGLRLRPKFYVWESVTRAYTLGRELVDLITYDWLNAGYSVTHFFSDLQWHGAAQTRKRFMLIAHKYKMEFEPPKFKSIACGPVLDTVTNTFTPTMPEHWVPLIERINVETDKDRALRATWDHVNRRKKPKLITFSTGRTVIKGRPPIMVHRVKPDRPCGTITSQVCHIHWRENRFLGHEELLKLCGFPLKYKFAGPPHSWQNQLAKGVMPPFAEFVSRHVAESLRQGQRIRKPEVRVVDFRTPKSTALLYPPEAE